ncbi:electron transfer flavoprotein subunit beta/FixA family protein [[Clostridium] aminophilum]|uniref:electron transfer flavoprotein subunit beta/FixA family protein n=1 Tax=[Clostridium] aminophilum TaxID=1526 RepID=UPI003F9E4E24
MNILVCIKQVPDDSVEVSVGADGKPAIDGITPVVNAFDTYSLEMAARLKESLNDGSEITALCVGPESAKNSLKNCLAVGADYAYLVKCDEVNDMDAMGIAEILKGAVEKLAAGKGKFDLIFTGKEATDMPLGQTGICLADKLGEAVITNIIDIKAKDGTVVAKHETEEGYRVIEAAVPAVLTVSKPEYDPRYPTIKNKMAARRKPIEELNLSELADAGSYAARIQKIAEYEPPKREAGIKIKEETDEDSAMKAIQMMADAKVI